MNNNEITWEYIEKIQNELIDFSKEVYTNQKEIHDILNMCKKYNVHSPSISFKMILGCQYLLYEYNRLNRFKKILGKRRIEQYMINAIKNRSGLTSVNTPMCTVASVFEDTRNNTTIIPGIRIYLDMSKIMMKLLMNNNRHKDVIDSCKLTIRHEFGHVVDYMSFIGRSYDDYLAESDRRDALSKSAKEEHEKYLKMFSDEEDKTKRNELSRKIAYAYYELDPYEVMANKYAHFTDEEYEQLVYNNIGLTPYW